MNIFDTPDVPFYYTIQKEGFDLFVKVEGEARVDEAIRFRDQLKTQAYESLRILIDFTDSPHFVSTGTVVVKELIKKLLKMHRLVIGVNLAEVFPHFQEQLISTNLVVFPSTEEARSYMDENPVEVLVIEDEPTTIEIVKAYLIKQHINPYICQTADEGIEVALSRLPRLILMDIQLPGMDGIQAVHQIRQQVTGTMIPILMFTSKADEATVKACKREKVNGYILKPLDEKRMSQRIVETLTSAGED